MLLALRRFESRLAALGNGSTFAAIGRDVIETFPIPLPPLPEQRRIAAALTERLDTIDRAKAGVEAQIEAARALPAAYLGATFESEEARAWPRVPLGEVVTPVRGVGFASGEARRASYPDHIACLATGAVQEELDWDAAVFIPTERVKPVQYLEPGDILMSTANSKHLVGKAAVCRAVPEPATFGAFVTVLRPKPESPSYLLHWLRSQEMRKFYFEASSNTTGISNLAVSEVLQRLIPIAPPDHHVSRGQLDHAPLAAKDIERACRTQAHELEALRRVTFERAFQGAV